MKDYKTQQRVLHSPFDIKTHKETFIDYLEVVIDEDGVVHYAVPSHMEWMTRYFCEKHGIDRGVLYTMFKTNTDFLTPIEYLSKLSECIPVWISHIYGIPNEKQNETLHKLANAGLYKGFDEQERMERLQWINDQEIF